MNDKDALFSINDHIKIYLGASKKTFETQKSSSPALNQKTTPRKKEGGKNYEKMIKIKININVPMFDNFIGADHGTRSELKHNLQFEKTIDPSQMESDTKKEENKI